MKRRTTPSKSIFAVDSLCITAIVILASLAISLHTPSMPSASATPIDFTPQSATSTPPPANASTQDERAQILGQIYRVAADYDCLVEQEESEGRLLQSTPANPEEHSLQLLNTSSSPLYLAWDNTTSQIQLLNEEYAMLFSGQLDPPPYRVPEPRPGSQDQVQRLIDAAGLDYVSWLEEEQRTGTFVVLFDPYEMRLNAILIGDSYVRERLHWTALLQFRLELIAPPIDQREADIEAVRSVVSGDPCLEDMGVLMPMYTDHELHLYVVGEWHVMIDPTDHQIILVDRQQHDTGPHQPQSDGGISPTITLEALEQRAIEFVQLVAPGIDLTGLTHLNDQKGDSFFFRWEDRTRPLLPDGRSFPFIQVALSGTGELLNYYNTL